MRRPRYYHQGRAVGRTCPSVVESVYDAQSSAVENVWRKDWQRLGNQEQRHHQTAMVPDDWRRLLDW